MRQAAQAARHSPRKTAGMLGIALVAALAIAAVVGYVPSAVTAAQAQYGPTNTAAPTISDTTPQTGQSLTASPGTWTGDAPIAFAYQWQRCNASGASCAAIPGATGQTYLVQSADQGNTLRVAVTATNAAGSATATSAATAAVTQGTGSVPIESVVLPNRLVIDQIRFVPGRISYSRTRTFTLTVRVRETNSNRPVSGALVFARSTPIVTTTPPERATNANGQVTFTISTERDFRQLLRPGYGLQFFVRARKGGENPLAGVSTRRLIQVSITR